jgi:uncharacterized protein YegL
MQEDDRYQVLPFYGVCDESDSMSGVPVDTVNAQFKPLHDAIVSDPAVSDRARFGIISFSSSAQVLFPLSDLSEVDHLPGLTAHGSTNYEAAFSLLRQQIADDVRRLGDEGYAVLRPAVFFFSDGYPNGPDWRPAYQSLVDEGFKQRPHIVSFGVGAADEQVIAQIGTVCAYQARDGVGPADALRQWATSFTNSIVASATAINQGTASFTPPPPPPGFKTVQPVSLPVVS